MKYIFSLFLLLSFACKKDTTTTSPTIQENEMETENEIKELTYLALGDSYTIGESVEYSNNYPSLLSARLMADEVAIAPPKIIARTGWTTGELINSIAQEQPASDYDLVSLLIGVNNQFRGQSQEVYAQEFEGLLKQAIGFAKGNKDKVIVLSIPDYAFTPFGQQSNSAKISREINAFNAINKKISETYEVQYFNITPISRQGVATPELVAEDGLHPSGVQYKQWVDLIYQTVKEEVLSN